MSSRRGSARGALSNATVRTALRGSGIGLLAAVVIPVSPALAQTVQGGAAAVTVPSSGQIVVDGQTVPVLPGVTRVVVAAPPAGSTPFQEDGQTEYQLPPGATGESFTYSSADSYGNSVTVPTTAVYGSTSTATPQQRPHQQRVGQRARSRRTHLDQTVAKPP
jgi:hypothetical protein